MDIAALSVVMHQSRIRQAASLSVMKRVMEMSQVHMQEMQKMLEMAVTPHLGANVDIRI